MLIKEGPFLCARANVIFKAGSKLGREFLWIIPGITLAVLLVIIVIEVDGAQYSGSGTIVRQAVVFSALTGRPVHIVNARAHRPKPGLRHQHVTVVEAIRGLVDGKVEGLAQDSRELTFWPGTIKGGHHHVWDIGSAGSATNLAIALLPILAFRSDSTDVELRGGLFQDFAPSFYHLQHVLLPLLRHMGIEAEVRMDRPGYVPRGDGILHLTVQPTRKGLRSLVMDHAGVLDRLWGIAIASHLEERRVSHRMAEAANEVLQSAGYKAHIELIEDTTSLQPGAALAVFADLAGHVRLGADQAGALHRRAESIGTYVAHQLLDDLNTHATLDRHAADQVIMFASLAAGESRFRIPAITEHVVTNAWLARLFLGVEVNMQEQQLAISGSGLRPVHC